MSRTAADYQQLLMALLPSGDIWTREAESTLGLLLLALAVELARTDGRLVDVLDEADPQTAWEMLADWESICGLPDQCYGDADTMAQRREAVIEHLTTIGDQRLATYEALAVKHGHAATVREFTPLRADFRAGDRSYGVAWAHVFRLESSSPVPVRYFRAGVSAAGERLVTRGDSKYECMISGKAPAHNEVQFAYLRRLATEDGTRLLFADGHEILL